MPDVLLPIRAGQATIARIASQQALSATVAKSTGVLKLLGFSGPWAPLSLVGSVAIQLLLQDIFKPKLLPLPVKSHNISGGREEARFVVGKLRIQLEWTDATALPGGSYRDNHIRLIACVSEQSCEDVTQIWFNQDNFNFQRDPMDSNHLIPIEGSEFVLPSNDVARYNFAIPNALEFRLKFKADGTENASALTTNNPRWEIPNNVQYNGNPGENDWLTGKHQRKQNTTKYRIPQPDPPPNNQPPYDYYIDYDVSPPVYRSQSDTLQTEPVTYNLMLFDGPHNVALEPKEIDTDYKNNGMSWTQIDGFQPFFQQTDQSTRLFKGIPNIDYLVSGIKMTVPGKSEKEWTDNPVAILYWIDTFYRGISAATINSTSFMEAFNDCNETIAYRYGALAPDNADGSNKEYYIRTGVNSRVYQKRNDVWVDIGPTQGDYNWLEAQGKNGIYNMKRYSCNLEILSGENIDDLYRKVLICCDGVRYESEGQIHYRVGKHRNSSLSIKEEDILEIEPVQTWQPIETRINKFVAKMAQSEQNDYMPDTVPFEDTAAITRDGETRVKEFVLDGVTNPLQAANLTSVLLKKARLFRSWPIRIGYFDDMAQLDIDPYDVITLSHNEFGLLNQKVLVLSVVKLVDATVALYCQEYDDNLYDPIFALPELRSRPFNYTDVIPPPELTGLVADEFASSTRAGTQIRLDIGWDVSNSDLVDVRYRKTGYGEFFPTAYFDFTANSFDLTDAYETEFPTAFFDFTANEMITEVQTASRFDTAYFDFTANEFDTGGVVDWRDSDISVKSGLLYKQLDLPVYYIGRAGGTDHRHENPYDQDSVDIAEVGYSILSTAQSVVTDPLNQAILGTNMKIVRVVAQSRGSPTGPRGQGVATLNIVTERFDTTDPRTNFTTAQFENIRFVFVNNVRDTDKVRQYIMMRPRWPNDYSDEGVRNFFRSAYRSNPKQNIDFFVIDNSLARYHDYRHHGMTRRFVEFDPAMFAFTANLMDAAAQAFSLNDISVVADFARGIRFISHDRTFTERTTPFSGTGTNASDEKDWSTFFRVNARDPLPVCFINATTRSYLAGIYVQNVNYRPTGSSVHSIEVWLFTTQRSNRDNFWGDMVGYNVTNTIAQSMTLVLMNPGGTGIVLSSLNTTVTGVAGGVSTGTAGAVPTPGKVIFTFPTNSAGRTLQELIVSYLRTGGSRTAALVDRSNSRVDLSTGSPRVS